MQEKRRIKFAILHHGEEDTKRFNDGYFPLALFDYERVDCQEPSSWKRVGSLIQTCNFELRFVEVRTADANFSSVSVALDDVRCH